MALPSAVASAGYDAANRITSWGGASMTHDANGNLTNDGAKTYGWNARNELTSVSGPNLNGSFAYDAFGRRRQRSVNLTTTRYLHDGDNPVQEQSALGAPTADLLTGLGLDQFYGQSSVTGTTTLVTDALGSTIAEAGPSGSVSSEYTYEPFGQPTVSGPSTTSHQFTGRDSDGTGLQYNRARYYSPVHSRFISEDPIGFAAGDPNLYAYVRSSPLNYTDPLGTWMIDVTVGEGVVFQIGIGWGDGTLFGTVGVHIGGELSATVSEGKPIPGPAFDLEVVLPRVW
jgi:RHS repeat-associated protein